MVIVTAKQPQLGHARAMRQNMIEYLEALAQQGDCLKIPLFMARGYYLNHPDDIRQILVVKADCFHKPFPVKYAAKGLFGENIFTTDGKLWEVLRQTLQPAFQSQQIKNHSQIMIQASREMVDRWEPGQTIEICQAMMDLTMGITTQAFFGVDLRGKAEGKVLVRFTELFNERISGIPVPAWLPLPVTLELKRYLNQGYKFFNSLIAERRAAKGTYTDILAMILNAQAADETGLITDQQVRNEVSNLFAAGYEVTGNSLAFTLYLIHKHPSVEARLRAEIEQVIGNRPITLDDLAQMPYLECVLKESMRLLPVNTVFARQSTTNVAWADRSIPKNSFILISPWTLHRRADIFADPLAFNPDRFEVKVRSQIPKFAYLPFGGGPRICLGQAFAMTQMRINLATILQQYRLTTAPDYQLVPYFSFNTRPKHGLPMQLEKV
ncbi:cytochrome P450 [Pleurocapsa sp. PCC 7319]|uniref:cytochrome P450 n=1 Tax=Pleurocapsa sp. PCC 7319 TaxID=118161 RepID=UPI000345F88A|nr:cytochrome P450 [Pleurocapsa sp. PCC 7319]